MSLALLLPAALAALAALLLPLLIHLARRSEQRITDFAALRWLAANPRPRRKRRFDERLLLCVRLLLLAALALLLARPVLSGRPDTTPWIVAAPGVPAAVARAAAGDGDARLRWLAPGFPGLDRPAPPAREPVASLLRELDATLPAGAPLTVLVPAVIDGADAQRPRLSRAVDWRIVADAPVHAADDDARAGDPPPREPADGAARAIPAHAAADATDGHSDPDVPAHPLQLVVRHAHDAAGVRYLRAAGIAWRTAPATPAGNDAADRDRSRPDAGIAPQDGRAVPTASAGAASPVSVADSAQPLPPGARNLAWLAPGPLPDGIRAWVREGGRVLLPVEAQVLELADAPPLWRDDEGNVLVRGATLGRGRLMQFTRALAPSAMPQLLEADFPTRLRALFADPPPAPARVDARDYAPATGLAPFPETPRPLSPWLVALVAALFALERWLASGPRREAAA
ncbi:MAG TPA: BatA domain-containing protein [Luteimonas sp.]|nr:BatA domain-containing protein [Luteimonas sp.]